MQGPGRRRRRGASEDGGPEARRGTRVVGQRGLRGAPRTLSKTASVTIPDDPRAYLLLAEAERGAGNETAAILALKRGQGADQDVSLRSSKRELVELFRRSGNPAQAVNVLSQLKESNDLTDDDVLMLAKLEAQQGQFTAAFDTLRTIYLKRPDDPKAKVLEAEVLLLSGRRAAGRQVDGSPGGRGEPARGPRVARPLLLERRLPGERAAGFGGHHRRRRAVARGDGDQGPRVERAQALRRSGSRAARTACRTTPRTQTCWRNSPRPSCTWDRPPTLKPWSTRPSPPSPGFRARCTCGRAPWSNRASSRRPLRTTSTRCALDPAFGPALSRMWRIYDHRGQRAEAMSALERLFFMNQATIERRKVAPGGDVCTDANQRGARQAPGRGSPPAPGPGEHALQGRVRSQLAHTVSNGPPAKPGGPPSSS